MRSGNARATTSMFHCSATCRCHCSWSLVIDLLLVKFGVKAVDGVEFALTASIIKYSPSILKYMGTERWIRTGSWPATCTRRAAALALCCRRRLALLCWPGVACTAGPDCLSAPPRQLLPGNSVRSVILTKTYEQIYIYTYYINHILTYIPNNDTCEFLQLIHILYIFLLIEKYYITTSRLSEYQMW